VRLAKSSSTGAKIMKTWKAILGVGIIGFCIGALFSTKNSAKSYEDPTEIANLGAGEVYVLLVRFQKQAAPRDRLTDYDLPYMIPSDNVWYTGLSPAAIGLPTNYREQVDVKRLCAVYACVNRQ
jgi:hypothetical protein